MRSLIARIPAFRLGRRLGRPLALPASLTVSVLYACNSRCKTCHVYENKAKVLSVEEYQRIFSSLGTAPRWVTVSGGEPFLRKELGEIVLTLWKHCRPSVINLPTNGSLPDAVEATVDRVTAEAKGTAFVVNLSIDEVGERHDELRGFPGSYARARDTLERLRRLKARRKNLTLGIHTVLSAYNEQRFEEIAEHCRALEPDSYIVEVAEMRVELGTVKDALAPSDEGLRRALATLRRHTRRGRTPVEALVAGLRREYYSLLERYQADRREHLPCFAAITSAHLMPEGKLWACCVLGETLGNLREAGYDFPAVWASGQADAIRARIKGEKCHCPLANQAYLNMLVDPKSLTRVAVRSAASLLESIRASLQVAEAMAAQYLPPELLRRLQLRRLQHMLRYCWEKVPLYRRLWTQAKVTPDDIRSLDDLPRLPIPDRRTVEDAQEDLISRDFLELYRTRGGTIRHSGGSSGGRQLEVHADPRSWAHLDAYYYRGLAVLGYRPWIPLAYYWGAPFKKRLHNGLGLMPKVGVPAQLDEAGQLAVLEQNPGIWWYYHPTSLFPLARRWPERLRALAPGRIIAHAELLSDSMRAAIESVMGQPVYNQYGTSEFNRMAWNCLEGPGYHVDTDSIVLEVLRDDGRPALPGEIGRAVVTGLVNHMMPLIRYELGDLLVPSDRRCACGRTLPMLESIEGRWRDRYLMPDGGVRTPRELLEPAGAVEGVELFRVTIETATRIKVEYVSGANEAGRASIEAELRRRYQALCPRAQLVLARVADIEKAPTGKRVIVRNLVPPAERGAPALLA